MRLLIWKFWSFDGTHPAIPSCKKLLLSSTVYASSAIFFVHFTIILSSRFSHYGNLVGKMLHQKSIEEKFIMGWRNFNWAYLSLEFVHLWVTDINWSLHYFFCGKHYCWMSHSWLLRCLQEGLCYGYFMSHSMPCIYSKSRVFISPAKTTTITRLELRSGQLFTRYYIIYSLLVIIIRQHSNSYWCQNCPRIVANSYALLQNFYY